jgi:hypothetical protein
MQDKVPMNGLKTKMGREIDRIKTLTGTVLSAIESGKEGLPIIQRELIV